jgi:hypothetical protein
MAKEMKRFLEALADLDSTASLVSSLDRRSILNGLAAHGTDVGHQLDRMLALLDSIEHDFSIIRQKLLA